MKDESDTPLHAWWQDDTQEPQKIDEHLMSNALDITPEEAEEIVKELFDREARRGKDVQ